MQGRGSLTVARRVRQGDVIIVDEASRVVERTLGVQGRKPKTGAPLMRIQFADGETIQVREDSPLRIIRSGRSF